MRVTLVALALALVVTQAWGADLATLAERAAAIERASTAPDGFRVVVGHLSRELGLPVDELRAQRLRSGLDWGAIFIANRLAKEIGMTFDEVLAAYRGGKTWEGIVREHKVDLEKLTSALQRTQGVVERRAEDKAPPPMEWKSTAPPGMGGVLPGIVPAPITTPGRSY
ncbi:MAG: hypothetical protein FJZ38_02840 [Candidatus Rokubacteria bacterium]|nr:hypothetical protein [Candidatus Rokubacteria bacterium]